MLWGRVEDIEIREGDHPWHLPICGPDEQGRMGPLPCQDLLLFTPLNPEADSPYGVSLLRGLPFLTDILMKIYTPSGLTGSDAAACASPSPAGTTETAKREEAEPDAGRRVVPGHAGYQERQRAGLCGCGRCGYPGHRR